LEELKVHTSYGNINVYKRGTGEKILFLLHGSGTDSAMLSWWGMMKNFTREYTVYAPDLLGYGKSDKPDIRGENFYPVHIQALNEMADQLGAEEFYLAGLSMGGAVAIGYALKYPSRVKALFPIDSWGLTLTLPFHPLSYWFIQKTNLTLWQYKLLGKSKWLVQYMLQEYLIGSKRKITNKMLGEVQKACQEESCGKAMQGFQRSSCDKKRAIPCYVQELHKLKMPVIFIHGEKDPLVPVSDIFKVVNLCPNGKVHVMRGCKHWPVRERPEEVTMIILENTDERRAEENG